MDDIATTARLTILSHDLIRAREAVRLADTQIDQLLDSSFPIEQMDVEFQAKGRAKTGLAALCQEIDRLRAMAETLPAHSEMAGTAETTG